MTAEIAQKAYESGVQNSHRALITHKTPITMMTNIKPQVHLQGRYSTAETCTLLGICRSTLYKKTKDGTIPVHYRKANMRPFYIGADIIAYWNKSF